MRKQLQQMLALLLLGWLGIWMVQRAAADTPTAAPLQADAPLPPDIVGGEPAAPDAWPWMVSLMQAGIASGRNAHFCGGALIAPEWVLTASHCVEGMSANQLDLTIGRYQLSSSSGQRIRAAQIRMHPSYNSNTLDYDYALVRLSQPASAPAIGLVYAPTGGVDNVGRPATVTGWGALAEGGGGPDVLYQVTVPIVSNTTCNTAYGGGITARMLCAGLAAGGKDSCQGDSGGPLMVRNASNSGWLQVGVVSWGDGCARPNAYGVYARVSQVTSWIESITGPLGGGPTVTPTPTATATATPTPTATPGGPTPTPTQPGGCTNLCRNGGFETLNHWGQNSTNGYDLICINGACGTIPVLAGQGVAWLGGGHRETSVLAQRIDARAGSGLTLQFSYYSQSDDTCWYDFARVFVRDLTNGGPAQQVREYLLCRNTNTSGWVRQTIDLSAYAGRQIQIEFRVITDGSLLSNFWLDNVRLWSGQSCRAALDGATVEPLLVPELQGAPERKPATPPTEAIGR